MIMRTLQKKDLNNVTLEQQYWTVKDLTKRSHVMRYGDLHIASNPIGWFQGEERLVQHRKHAATENSIQKKVMASFRCRAVVIVSAPGICK
ncbi:hypothetical protein OESDEN_09115 [Oesophagostomum dentatum]|uniref:Uncharacterized protein n=1 Tax=Oesophagostomum dentatum TaxID=61180 RepID=A0A0B1T0E8_OESDE|nr:hypothetical protein OESDEN_09115 [Oesophagostomum dentatum]